MSADEARAALARVLDSQAFANAGRLSRFLRFTSERTLDGEPGHLKEYVLGVEVFDRTEAFDPRIDSIVRVEARRLRAKLAEYYEEEGARDTVIIRMRKGSYAPRFEWRNGQEAAVAPAAAVHAGEPSPQHASLADKPSARWRMLAGVAVLVLAAVAAAWGYRAVRSGATPALAVAVLPLEAYTGGDALAAVADQLTDGIRVQLARNPALVVRSRTSSAQFRGRRGGIRDVARALDARLLIEASVRPRGQDLDVEVRLVDATMDRKVWVDGFVGARDDLPALERRVAAGIAAAIQRHTAPP